MLLNGAMVSWASKRQPVISISSTESEFYSVSLCGLDCMYLLRIMDMMGYKQIAAMAIAPDNNACIYLVKDWSSKIERVTLTPGSFTSRSSPRKRNQKSSCSRLQVQNSHLISSLRDCQDLHSRSTEQY